MRTLRACAFLFCMFFFPPFLAAAQDHLPIGTVVALKGDVRLNGGLKLQKDDQVFLYNVIRTGPDGRVVILMIDDTEIALGANSELEINEFVFDPYDAEENRAHFGFVRGVFQFVSGMISKREAPQVDLDTPYGTIGIRGTIVWGGTIEDKYGVYVGEGEALYALPEADIGMAAGTGVILDPDDPGSPKPDIWSEERLAQAKEKLRFLNAEELKRLVEQEMTSNIARRHEYRRVMWPYKEIPYYDGDGEFPYSDEFLMQKKLHQQRIQQHNERMRDWR